MESIKYTRDFVDFFRGNTSDGYTVYRDVYTNTQENFETTSGVNKIGGVVLGKYNSSQLYLGYVQNKVLDKIYIISKEDVEKYFTITITYGKRGSTYINLDIKITDPRGINLSLTNNVMELQSLNNDDVAVEREFILQYTNSLVYNYLDMTFENVSTASGVFFVRKDIIDTKEDGIIQERKELFRAYGTNVYFEFEDYDFLYTPVDGDTPWGDDSSTDGGDGTFDNVGDEIETPEMGGINIGSNLLATYSLGLSELNELSDVLFTPGFLETLSQFLLDPFDYIISLDYVPFFVGGVTTEMKYGYLSTGVMAEKLATNFVSFDFGNVELLEFWGGFLDYSPNTNIELYLPFKGFVTVDTDVVMGKAVNLTYNIDLFTGTGVAILSIYTDGVQQVVGSYDVDVAMRLPLTGNNYSQMISSIITGVANIGSSIADGGGALAVGGAVASTTASVLSSSKPTVHKVGNVGGNKGFMNVLYPYFQISRPIQCRPTSYSDLVGYTSETYQFFNSIHGFTVVRDVQLKGIPCIASELEEIEKLLKEGVIF